MTLNEIKACILNWENIIKEGNSETIIHYLNQGFCFQITKSEYLKWKDKKPKNIHAYLGVYNNKLKFFIIDSKSDKNGDFSDTILIKDFTYGIDPSEIIKPITLKKKITLTENQALDRSFRWHIRCKEWLQSIQNDPLKQMFRVISIPFQNYVQIFQSNTIVTNFFGLHKGKTNEALEIEIIVSNEYGEHKIPNEYKDLTVPVPPFSAQNSRIYFNLLD
ncbi:hypothetical protein [Flavivirga eckloniae]|uniref:Uncharacterized protein n=1 Tax=Flavivirga eckloniae TaxID=1803846 RepID=A0A2K9PJZ1_9FLAO|nr:hypothetical protein [Flavivirga eckloniae]AUP77370.1 hypothetical protein C1H87_00995 [Flavivirga eckloniae]